MGMHTPQDIAVVLGKHLKFSFKRHSDHDEWTSKNGRVGVDVSAGGRWLISFEEVRKKGFGIGPLIKTIKGFVDSGKSMHEMTATGGIEGFGTPYAFAGNDEDKKKVNEAFEKLVESGHSTSGGLEVVKGGKVVDTLDLPHTGHSVTYKSKNYKLQPDKKVRNWYFIDLDKPLNEHGDPYYPWRNDETQTPRQKIGGAISEINKQLREVEKVVKRTQRLKKETGTSNNALWNRTNKALMKIESRMHRISQTIRNMRG